MKKQISPPPSVQEGTKGDHKTSHELPCHVSKSPALLTGTILLAGRPSLHSVGARCPRPEVMIPQNLVSKFSACIILCSHLTYS